MSEETDKPYDPPENPNIAETFHPYSLDTGQAFMLGTLVGLLDQALRSVDADLSVSPVTDQQGNYLRLVRFTLDEGAGGPFSWVLSLVIER